MASKKLMIFVVTSAVGLAVLIMMQRIGGQPDTVAERSVPLAEPETAESFQDMASSDDDQAVTETVDAYRSNWALGERVRAFNEASLTMPREERERLGDALLAAVDQAEEDGLLVADQPEFMKIAVYRSIYQGDREGLEREVQALAAERAARRESLPPIDHGPIHDQYKEREAEILAEVLAMDSYPDGLSQSAYLAQRLQALREELYAIEPQP